MIRARWIVLPVAIVAWFVALAAWIDDDPRLSDTAYDAFSSYNTSPGGLSQAFAYLTARHHSVKLLASPVVLAHPSRNATILRVGAERFSSIVEEKHVKRPPKEPVLKRVEKLLDDDEEAWVRAGGRLVIAPAGGYGEVHLDAANCGDLRRVFPVDPPLPRIDVPACHSMSGSGLQRFHSLLSAENGPVLMRRKLGAGEIILFSIPEAFSNEYLARGGHLSLLERLAGENRTVYFDEMIHGIGEETSIWDLLLVDWRLGPALLVLALAALAWFWRRVRPTGSPERDARDSRSEAIDLVQSMGQLYDRALDREESLRLYYQGLLRAVHARTRLTGEPLERLVRERTQGYDPGPKFQDITREEFQRMLKILNEAYETVGYANTR